MVYIIVYLTEITNLSKLLGHKDNGHQVAARDGEGSRSLLVVTSGVNRGCFAR